MKKDIGKIIAALLIGIILGISGMNAYISKEYEILSAKNKTLQQQVDDLNTDLEEMTERLENTQKNKIINDIKVRLELAEENDLPAFEKTSVKLDGEDKITNLLIALKGQGINNVNYNLIPKIVNGREFVSEGRRYSLNVEVVIITEELHIYATASLLEPN